MANEEANCEAGLEDSGKRGVFDGFSGYVTPTEEDWKDVLSGGMIVVDTNVLLNLYRYNQDAREALLATLRKFDSRLWVPHQVMDEFWRNRDSALEDPEKQLRQSVTALQSGLERVISDLRHWVNRVSLNEGDAAELESMLSDALGGVVEKMGSVVHASGEEMERDTERDRVVLALSALLDEKVGGSLTPREYAAAIVEGKRRIENQIPPGYKDKKKQSLGDDTEVGDYLVWLQLIKEAKRRGKDVLLVTGDGKEDWWRTRNKISLGPRNELSEELLRESGARLYMLKPERLLAYARDFLHVEVSDNSVQNVEMVEARLGTDGDFQTLKAMTESDPVAAILGAWRQVEVSMQRALPPGYQHVRNSTAETIRALKDQDVISEAIAQSATTLALRRFRYLQKDSLQLAPNESLEFVSAAKKVVDTLALATTPQALVQRYQKAVIGAILLHDFEVHNGEGLANQGYDFLVRGQGEGGVVAVVVKFNLIGPFREGRIREVRVPLVSQGEEIDFILIVTNSPLDSGARKRNRMDTFVEASAHSGEGRIVRVVQWGGPADNEVLIEALDTFTSRT